MVLSADLNSILLNEGLLSKDLDAKEVAKRIEEEKQRFKSETVKPTTNRGIKLGMSQQEVRRILGKPTRSIWSDKFQSKELIYTRETPKDKEGISIKFSNYYLFRGDRLYYVELARDTIGGP